VVVLEILDDEAILDDENEMMELLLEDNFLLVQREKELQQSLPSAAELCQEALEQHNYSPVQHNIN